VVSPCEEHRECQPGEYSQHADYNGQILQNGHKAKETLIIKGYGEEGIVSITD
jgi:hypothetical protein